METRANRRSYVADVNEAQFEELFDLLAFLEPYSTVLARAGLQPFNGMQGANLLPILAGERRDRGLPVLIETTTQYPYLGFDGLVSVATLIDGRWRLSVWQGRPWGELYDLRDDPWEMKKLWDDPARRERKSSLLLKLVHAIQDHGETSPYPLSVS